MCYNVACKVGEDVNKLSYEEYLDNNIFYTRNELKNERPVIYKNTLYIKSSSFYKNYFHENSPMNDLFIKFLTQKGLFQFLLSMLEDKNISYIEFNYNDEVKRIKLKDFFSFYISYSVEVRNSSILEKIAEILHYNNFDFSANEDLTYLIDDNKYNSLLYKKEEQERIDIIKRIFRILKRKKIIERYFLEEKVVTRLEYLTEKYLKESTEQQEKREHQYIIDSSIIAALDYYKKDTYSKLEEAIYYFIALSNLVVINPISAIDINDVTLDNNYVSAKTFYLLFITILNDLGITFTEEQKEDTFEITIDNKIKFSIGDDFDSQNISNYLTNLTDDAGIDEIIYKILNEYKESIEKGIKFDNSFTKFKNHFNKDTMNRYDKLKTFIELITRGEKIADQKYQKIIFNIFYGDNPNYKISFYKSMTPNGNYHFFTILNIKDQYILIDSDNLAKIKLVSMLEVAELQKKSIDLSEKIVIEEVTSKHVQ